MKFIILLSLVFCLSGCEIPNSEVSNEEINNIGYESIKEESTESVDIEGDNKEVEQLFLKSIYVEDANRDDFDTEEYLNLGDSMNMYVKNEQGEESLIQEVTVEDYFVIKMDDPELSEGRWDLHFILGLEEFAVENLQFDGKMVEVDSKVFYEDINLGNYYHSALDESGNNIERFRRFSKTVTYDEKKKFSCNLPLPPGEYEGDKRICTIAFSYAGPGEYLLSISDKVGGFKNYLIDVE